MPKHALTLLFSCRVVSAVVVLCSTIGADAGVGALGMASRKWTSSVWLLNASSVLHVQQQHPFTPMLLESGGRGSTAATIWDLPIYVNSKFSNDNDILMAFGGFVEAI